MKKETVLKRGLFVSLICTAVFAVTFISLFLLLPLTYNKTFGIAEGGADIGQLFTQFTQAFVSLFDQEARLLYQASGNLSESGPLTIAALVLVLAAILFTWLVFMIIFLINKKHPRYIVFAAPYLLVSFISLLVVSTGAYLNAFFIKSAEQVVPVATGLIVMVYFTIISGGLSFIALVVSNAFAIPYILELGKEEEVVEVEEAEPTVAEEAGDVEAVEEVEEIPEPAEAHIEEAEPEPIPEVDEASMIEEEVEPEVEEEPLPEKKVEEEPAEEESVDLQKMDKDSLASLLKEVVRDIVRDEMARNNPGNSQVTGATFGGPLVVQYFNGGINTASPEEAPKEEKKVEVPAPKKEEPKPEKAPLFVKKEVVGEEVSEEKKYERLTFAERLLQSDKEIHNLYNEIKNEILSYGVKSRISAVGDTFRLHKKMYVRITVAGKSLKLYFALNPRDYASSTLPIQDASNKEMYVDIPLCFKVRSPLSIRRCKELIQDVMDKDRLEQGEIGKVNWVKELKAELASGKKFGKDED